MKEINKSIDSLKVLLAFSIIFHHLYEVIFKGDMLFYNIYHPFYLSVDAFFVISGFFLGSSVKQKTLKEYLTGRIKRLYPEYFIVLLYCLVLSFIFRFDINISLIIPNFLLIDGFFGINGFSSLVGPLWFVSNLFFVSLLFFTILRNNVENISYIFLLIFICIGIKITFFGRTILHSSPIFIINAGLLRCIIDVGLGVILYLVRLYYLQCKRAYQIVLSIISFIIIFYILKHDNTIYSFLIVFPFCIVFLSLYSKKGMFYLILEKIYVKNISECSYMLYLSHIDVIYLFYYCVHNKIIFDSLDLTDKILITLFVVLLSVLQSFLLIKVKNIIFNKVIKF